MHLSRVFKPAPPSAPAPSLTAGLGSGPAATEVLPIVSIVVPFFPEGLGHMVSMVVPVLL